jgi:hypothetical protein
MNNQLPTVETLQEFCDSRGLPLRVDPREGVIRGVKILGAESRNGRSYPSETLRQAAALYEEAKVNVNHPKGDPASPRDYQDRIGVIRNVAARRDEGLFADFHFNPKHALSEQLLWDAEHAPENVGFSHNVEARLARRGDRVVVEEITRVQSVDLVADPATTRGLFEHSQKDELSRLRAEVERLRAEEAARRKQEALRDLLREFHLPEPESADPQANAITSRRFVEMLLATPSEQEMHELIEDRSALVRVLQGSMEQKENDRFSTEQPAGCRTQKGPLLLSPRTRPLCREQHSLDELKPLDTKAFVEAIGIDG